MSIQVKIQNKNSFSTNDLAILSIISDNVQLDLIGALQREVMNQKEA